VPSLAFGRSLVLIADANLRVQAMILFLICFSLICVLFYGCFLRFSVFLRASALSSAACRARGILPCFPHGHQWPLASLLNIRPEA
jgi:hypothetical protein